MLKFSICADAYISWISDGKYVWKVGAGGVGANELTQISARPVPKEPMVGVCRQVSSLRARV
jgi:hypothetical protein